jgi:Putative beta-barrel porin-2, OmpL-like. bbp2
MLRKGLAAGAALVVLALGGAAMADDSNAGSQSAGATGGTNVFTLPAESVNPQLMDTTPPAPAAPEAPAAPAAAPAAASPPEGAIMWGLDQIGVGKFMEDLHLSLTGYGDMGYFYDLTVPKNVAPPRSAPPTFVGFPGDYKNDLMLNQVELDFQRTIADPSKFDIGFNIEGLYGRDAVYTHSDGILDNGNKHGKTSPDDDIDLEQAYLLVSAPLGTGLEFQIGKFDTLLGYEVINPTGNPLYTHSYEFSYGVPFTQTGILATYNLTSALKLTAGITRGWNQSTDDNNGAIDFLGQAAWNINSAWSATVNLSEGPQSTGDNHDYWTVVEGIVAWQVSDQLKLAGDFLYGDANAIAQWYAAAGYADYTLNKFAAINLRGEFYHDGRGFTTGVGRTDTNYIEGTLGVAVTPTPDVNLLQTLTIRPEVRVDMADQGVYDGRKYTQLTMAVDAYLKF